MNKVKIDFSKVLVSDYMELLVSIGDPTAFLKFADKAVVGGIKNRSILELPSIFSQLTKALQNEMDNITIAVTSMQKYLKNEDDDPV